VLTQQKNKRRGTRRPKGRLPPSRGMKLAISDILSEGRGKIKGQRENRDGESLQPWIGRSSVTATNSLQRGGVGGDGECLNVRGGRMWHETNKGAKISG